MRSLTGYSFTEERLPAVLFRGWELSVLEELVKKLEPMLFPARPPGMAFFFAAAASVVCHLNQSPIC